MMKITAVLFTLLSACCLAVGQSGCPAPAYEAAGSKVLPPNSHVNVFLDTSGNGVTSSSISIIPVPGNDSAKFTLGTGSNASSYLNGMQMWNAFTTTDGSGISFGSGPSSSNINWVVTTMWPSATVSYLDTAGHAHTVTETGVTGSVASTFPLLDYGPNGGPALNTVAGFVTLIDTNGTYSVTGVNYPVWDPNGPNFNNALNQNGGHETGHGFGLGDQPTSAADIMSQWGPASVSSPSGATNNQAGGAADVVTSCDASEVKNNPNAPYGAGGTGAGGGNGGPPPPPPTCSQGGTLCQYAACVPPACYGQTQWDPEYCECYGYTSPIIVDTDGSGFHLTSASNGVSFDFFGTGTPMQIAWTAASSTNGWLALDRDGNGTIDSAKELFGNITDQPPSNNPNGFLALAVFDSPEEGGNGDGVIDDNDAIWPALRVWIDANHDGISQPYELYTLEQVGISAIDLNYTESRHSDQYGNVFRFKGRLVPVVRDTVRRVIYDVVLTNLDSLGKLNGAPKISPWVSLRSDVLPDEIFEVWASRRSGQDHCAPLSNGIPSQQ